MRRRVVLCAVAMVCGVLGVAAPVALAAGPCGSSGVYAVSGSTATCTYSAQGTEDTFTVPGGVTSLSVTAVGAPGGAGNGVQGGQGAQVVNTALSVNSGTTLYVDVGETGGGDAGAGCCGGGSGGGSSALLTTARATAVAGGELTGNPSTDARLLVAGGGGGGALFGGGGSAGDVAVTGAGAGGGCFSGGSPGGVGPTDGSSGGGAGGSCLSFGTGGSGGAGGGGAGTVFSGQGGGGGGGGWFGGGGGGLNDGAGGGSSYPGAGCTSACVSTASSTQASEVVISWTLLTPSINTSQRPPSATVGSSIADKATVSGGDGPTGTVTFNLYDNPNGTGTPLFTDTEPLVSGVATSAGYTTTVTGTDYWVATYNGDSTNNSVSSGTADEPVAIISSITFGPFATSTSVSCSPNPAITNQMVTCTADVSPVPDGGTMQFTDPGVTIPRCGAVPVNTTTGQASCTTTFNTPGSYQIQAVYPGDELFTGSQSPVITQTVTAPPPPPPAPPTRTSLRLSASPNPVVVGQQVTYTATVSPSPNGGHVTFFDNGHVIPGCANVAATNRGTATCKWAYTWAAVHTIRARYTGTPQFTNSAANKLTETVKKRPHH